MEPINNFVKLETCELDTEPFIMNHSQPMHNNQFGQGSSSSYTVNNREYVSYHQYAHNEAEMSGINEHRNGMVDAVQRHYDQIIKSKNDYTTFQSPGFDGNNYTQLSSVERSNELDTQPTESDDIPIVLNGKYFKIIEEMKTTEQQRVARSVIAMCQHCSREKVKPIQGSMRITSNFVRHLKTLHPAKYEEFIVERQLQTRTPRGRRAQKRGIFQIANENHLRTEGYVDDDINDQSQEGATAFTDNTQPTSTFNANNTDNNDMYSAESNDTHMSEESIDKKSGIYQPPCDPNEIPTILNGKYFKIIEQDTNSNRASIGVVAACQFCETDKLVKGPLKVTSNFIQHLRNRHFKEYNMYLQDKFNGSNRCRRSLTKQPTQLPIVEKLLNFFISTNVPISVMEEPTFVELFRGTGISLCTSARLLVRLDDMHSAFVENIKYRLQEVPHICVAADIWSSQNKQYFGYTCFWLDNDLKRQMAVLACVKLCDMPSVHDVETLIKQIHNKYELNEDKIICTVVDGVQDFAQTFHNFSIKSICPDNCREDLDITFGSAQPLLNQLPKRFQWGEHSLHILIVFDFYNILKAHEMLHQILTRALNILSRCNDFEANEVAVYLFECRLAPDDVRWPVWYASLTQLLTRKQHIDELCTFLNVSKFSQEEIEYLKEFCMILKPIADALEFLQQENYLYHGYFLPTIVTIKVKLQKLHDCRHIKHLHSVAQQLSNALLQRLQKYFELSSECNDAIISAIVCPAVKMRFLEAMRETAPNVSTETLIELLTNYAEEFYTHNEQVEIREKQRQPSVDTFLCFNPEDNEEAALDNKPSTIIRKELLSYVHDEDKTFACLNRYPLVQKVFHKYNTMPPTSMALNNFYQTFLNVSNGQKGQQLTDEQLERLVLTKVNKLM
ncbi:uncharacterized protein LOC101463035 [Ceratitis capitata]|uniref:(Mediterranean fruit fly) hypothetical protein n=1 Tax=Ceratitis capitata TaxID=7213 RepID=W8BA95_CERCA|nr:uncharacterized protein LOC101463035 [Ceratitis capitata]XP_012158097.1 uncharacterized protein LOC101463035 [Ceratitis capitata]CAD7012175.1 unnamed protein product [Ceratitis capitata]